MAAIPLSLEEIERRHVELLERLEDLNRQILEVLDQQAAGAQAN